MNVNLKLSQIMALAQYLHYVEHHGPSQFAERRLIQHLAEEL